MALPSNKSKAAGAAALAAMLAIAIPSVQFKEGLSLVPYQDVNHVWTICNGDTIGVTKDTTATKQSCSTLLIARLSYFGMRVDNMVYLPMTAQRWAGLTSFAYNVGLGTFEKSTLLKKLNENDPNACAQILRFKFVGKMDCSMPQYKQKCGGIITRRQDEYRLCMGTL